MVVYWGERLSQPEGRGFKSRPRQGTAPATEKAWSEVISGQGFNAFRRLLPVLLPG
jgi:hypothetical protein